MGTNTETHHWTISRERETLELLVVNEMSPSISSPEKLGMAAEKNAEKV